MIEELDCLMQTVSRNTGINNSVSEGSEGSEECGRENQYSLREYLNHNNRIGDRSTHIKGSAGESSKGNVEHVVGQQKKGDHCYIMAERLSKLCSTVRWKA